jgi:transcriptional regulator of arginine metabolism
MHAYLHNIVQREDRLQVLREIVEATSVRRQDQIVRLLRKNGFAVTQASVSRDLEELGIAKENGVYRTSAQVPRRTTFGTVSFDVAGENLIVAKCGSGLASALAVRLDARRLDGIVGTIAGDDTVFIAITDHKTQKRLLRRLREDIGE